MDKHRQEITVRINGRESPFTMDKPKQLDKAEIPENRIDENANRVESSGLSPSLPSINKKRNKSNIWNARAKSAVISIVIAIMVGTSFGFMY